MFKMLCFRTSHGADLSARAAAGVEEVGSVGLEPADADAGRHLQPLEDGAARGIDAADLALVAFPGAVPQLAVDPGHAGDEAVRLDRADDGTRVGIDLVDLAVAVLPDPEAPLGPREARVAAVAGRGNRGDHVAARGIDLVDTRLGDLVEVLAVERGAGVAGAGERAHGLAARGIEGEQRGAGGDPHTPAIMGDAVDALCTGERTVLAHDLGGTCRCIGSFACCLAGHGPAPCLSCAPSAR